MLSQETIPSTAFDGIWTLQPDAFSTFPQTWLYEPRLENLEVTHFRGLHSYTDDTIAEIIAVGTEAHTAIANECRDDSVARMRHYQQAKKTPIRLDEQNKHPGLPLRRCPACLKPTSSHMTYCLCCSAEFLGQFHCDNHVPGQAPNEAPYRVPPQAPNSRSQRSSSAPPATTTRNIVTLDLPEVAGVTWGKQTITHQGSDWEFVLPEPRIRQAVDSAGHPSGLPNYLAFRDGQAYGSYLSINYIYYDNVGINMLKRIDKKWPPKGDVPNHESFLAFLRARHTPKGTLEHLLHPPQVYADGWLRYGWSDFDEDLLEALTADGAWAGGKSDWNTAWHGTKLECLYKVMMDGRLSERTCLGRRIKDGKPGVYMMKDAQRHKALGYARYVCLNDDGVWVRAMWEVMTDRHDSVKSGNDQWIGRERSVRLKALWVQVSRAKDLEMGDEVQWAWDPALEFQPLAVPPVAKGMGKGKLPIPPKLPTVDFDSAPTSSGSATGLHTDSGGIPGSAMDVVEEEVIPPLAAAGVAVQQGEENHEYRQALLEMRNDVSELTELCKRHVHSPREWLTAWQELAASEVDRLARILAAKLVIWLQTRSFLSGDEFHHKGLRVESRPPVVVHYYNETYLDISEAKEVQIHVKWIVLRQHKSCRS